MGLRYHRSAQKEVDWGQALQAYSDASYGASFTIVNMMDVDEIIRDSKAT